MDKVAYQAGVQACINGQFMNPYEIGSKAAISWTTGYGAEYRAMKEETEHDIHKRG